MLPLAFAHLDFTAFVGGVHHVIVLLSGGILAG